ncbi:MAG: FG-GAP-like repeat-containing protein [Bacteroidota bacterium]
MKNFRQTLSLIFSLLFSTPFLIGQVCIDDPLFDQVNSSNGGLVNQTAMVAGDMDKDGDIDIVAAFSENNGQVIYYENDGSQNFSPSAIANSNFGIVQGMALGDLNCDDLPDLAISNATQKEVQYFRNAGNGSFNQLGKFSAVNPHQVQIVDMDRNGLLDFVYAATDDNQVVVQYNNGGNNFSKNPILINQSGMTTFDIGDLQCDGDLDLVVGTASTNTLYRVTNTGNNMFSTTTITTNAGGVSSVYYVDMDTDGDLDIVASLSTDNSVVWYEQDVNGNFSNSNTIASNITDVADAIPTDLDGDGDQDVVVAVKGQNRLMTYVNKGTSVDFKEIEVAKNMEGIFTAIPLDADNDKDIDIFTAPPIKMVLSYFENKCTHCSSIDWSDPTVEIANSINGARSARPVDWDKDGDLDFIVLSAIDNIVYLLTNDGQENFTKTTLLALPVSQSIGNSEIADLDNDGDLDIIGLEFNSSTLFWYKRNSNGTFTYRLISTDARATFMKVLDFDKDGWQDILIAGQNNDDGVVFFENSSTQSFKRTVLSNPAEGIAKFDVGDMDNDGDLDFVTSSLIGLDKYEWLEQTSNLNFTTHTIATGITRTEDVVLADVDGDNHLDFVTFNDAQHINWYKNNGSQTFTVQSISSTYDGINNLKVADIDSDGDMDVLIGRIGGGGIYIGDALWFRNTNTTFAPIVVADIVGAVEELDIADLDQDGDQDIILANFFGDKIYWSSNSCDFECAENDLAVNNRTVKPGDYQGINTIISENATVEGTVSYKAGTSITLETGFHAKAGSDFTAMIDNCPSSLQSSNTPLVTHRTNTPEVVTLKKMRNELSIAPNPAYGQATIRFSLAEEGPVYLTLHNLQGAMVQSFLRNALHSEGTHPMTFETGDLLPGIYWVSLWTEEEILTKKLVIAK